MAMRRLGIALLAVSAALVAAPATADPSFTRFVAELWPDARTAGVSRNTFDAAFRGITPDPKVEALTRKQSEFVRPISDYVAGAVSPARLATGGEMATRWASTLDTVERSYGVPREVVLAVWGMESGFGANAGGLSVVRSLATLAFVGYRGDFFRGELVQALRILEEGHVGREGLKGSWAGAMGQTQFMPSSFRDYAVDGNGDGRRDIWTNVPDALASTANYLKEKGWRAGLPWGFEVGLRGTVAIGAERQPFAAWAAAGVERVDGRPMPRTGEASLFLPMGVRGPAFLVSENFQVIRAYNSSDAYALGVGYLANRLAGARALSRTWPTADALDLLQRKEVQTRLGSLGLYKGEADGRHGAVTRDAIRAFQSRAGLVTDGYADAAVLKALRERR